MSVRPVARSLLEGYRDIVRTVRSIVSETERTGQLLALLGIAAFISGYGLFVLGESSGYNSANFFTYRRFAGVLAGLGLPTLLHGLVVALPNGGRTSYVSLAGALACAAAVLLFSLTYPHQWNVAGTPDYVVETVTAYGVGTVLCSAAAGGALNAHFQDEDVSEFIWGDPPES